jgi:CDGSH-type Zn-finger protein
VKLPNYLKAVPLPKTIGGFASLTREEWLELLPLLILVSVLIYLAISPIIGSLFTKKVKRPRVNNKIELESEKVATNYNIEDLGDKKVFCRCWKSSKFPYCDGSHNQHNKDTGDNVGPLIVKSFDNKEVKKEEKKKDLSPKEN